MMRYLTWGGRRGSQLKSIEERRILKSPNRAPSSRAFKIEFKGGNKGGYNVGPYCKGQMEKAPRKGGKRGGGKGLEALIYEISLLAGLFWDFSPKTREREKKRMFSLYADDREVGGGGGK